MRLLSQDEADKERDAMSLRLMTAYEDTLKPAFEGFLNDPRTKAYLGINPGTDFADAPLPPAYIMQLSVVFGIVVDPVPPNGPEGIDYFLYIYFTEATKNFPDKKNAIVTMVATVKEHAQKLKDFRTQELN